MVAINEVFLVRYGNKLDANKLTFTDEGGINFVSRSSKNLGVVGCVEPVPGQAENEAGLITVTMGGSYLLSAFVQPEPFYTAQNIKILAPREQMSLSEKAFYCRCITENRRRYSTHGREANRSFELLSVPSREEVPSWAKNLPAPALVIKNDHKNSSDVLVPNGKISLIRLDELFEVKSGLSLSSSVRSDTRSRPEFLPYIRPSKNQTTSFVEYVDSEAVGLGNIYPRHTLYVSTNGQGSHTYAWVSASDFVPNSDVSVLLPKRSMSLQEKLYYAAVISANRRLFSYGRKPKGERLKGILVPNLAPHFIYTQQLTDVLEKSDSRNSR